MPLDSHDDLENVSVDSMVVIDMVSRGVEYSNHGAVGCDKHTVFVLVPTSVSCGLHAVTD